MTTTVSVQLRVGGVHFDVASTIPALLAFGLPLELKDDADSPSPWWVGQKPRGHGFVWLSLRPVVQDQGQPEAWGVVDIELILDGNCVFEAGHLANLLTTAWSAELRALDVRLPERVDGIEARWSGSITVGDVTHSVANASLRELAMLATPGQPHAFDIQLMGTSIRASCTGHHSNLLAPLEYGSLSLTPAIENLED